MKNEIITGSKNVGGSEESKPEKSPEFSCRNICERIHAWIVVNLILLFSNSTISIQQTNEPKSRTLQAQDLVSR